VVLPLLLVAALATPALAHLASERRFFLQRPSWSRRPRPTCLPAPESQKVARAHAGEHSEIEEKAGQRAGGYRVSGGNGSCARVSKFSSGRRGLIGFVEESVGRIRRAAPHSGASLFRREADARLSAMERVVAVELGSGWAPPFMAMGEAGVANATFGGIPLIAFSNPGPARALHEAETARGRDVGETAVYDLRLGDRVLTLRPVQGGFRDRETGSGWTSTRRAVDGPLARGRLRPIPHGNHFWFARAVFGPETEVWQP
jgi:hypothetical protein